MNYEKKDSHLAIESESSNCPQNIVTDTVSAEIVKLKVGFLYWLINSIGLIRNVTLFGTITLLWRLFHNSITRE